MLFAAATLAVANGSHFHVSFQNGFQFDVKLGAESSALVTMLGLAGIAALIAGAVGALNALHDAPAAPAPAGVTLSLWDRLRGLTVSEKDAMLGGVCGGLGEHTPVPSWMWRAAFCVMVFWVGTGLLAYIILWICVPNPPKEDATPPKQK